MVKNQLVTYFFWNLIISKKSEIIETNTLGPDSFNVLDYLGTGSFGTVYLVQKKGENTLYAMKTIKKELIFRKNL